MTSSATFLFDLFIDIVLIPVKRFRMAYWFHKRTLRNVSRDLGPLGQNASRRAVHLHLHHGFYEVPWVEAFAKKCSHHGIDLFLTVTENYLRLNPSIMLSAREGLETVIVQNKGRDLRPFYVVMQDKLMDYDIIGHFHSKRQRGFGLRKTWVADLVNFLEMTISQTAPLDMGPTRSKEFMWLPDLRHSLGSRFYGWNSCNRRKALMYLGKNELSDDFIFPAGSFFWMSNALYRNTSEHIVDANFRDEDGLRDGGYEHFVERLPGYILSKGRQRIIKYNSLLLVVGGK